MRIAEIMQEIRDTNVAHGFRATGRALFCEKLALMHSELSEALEEFRAGEGLAAVRVANGKPEGIPVELADAVIRIFDWCAANGVDLEAAIRLKVDYNKSRPFKHGKEL